MTLEARMQELLTAPLGTQEVLAAMTERGLVEWNLACTTARMHRLARMVATSEVPTAPAPPPEGPAGPMVKHTAPDTIPDAVEPGTPPAVAVVATPVAADPEPPVIPGTNPADAVEA